MRYLALDLGDRRTGVAVGDAITGMAAPVEVIEVSVAHGGGEHFLRAIDRIVEEHLGPPAPPGREASGAIVVGLPLNMDGTEGPRARIVRELARKVGERTGREIHFQDERLTSADADWRLARTGLTHKQKKERRDALAAAAILEDFLIRRRNERDQKVSDDDKRPAGGES